MDSENPGNYLEKGPMELNAIYTKDSKRFHVFQLEGSQGVTGSLYFPKDGDKIPDRVVVVLKTPGEKSKSS